MSNLHLALGLYLLARLVSGQSYEIEFPDSGDELQKNKLGGPDGTQLYNLIIRSWATTISVHNLSENYKV